MYSVLCLLWFVPAVGAQIFALIQHWGNVSKITDITFEVAAAISNSSIGLYLVLNRNQLQIIISKMRSTFQTYIRNLRFGTKHSLILSEASRRNAIFSWIVIASNLSSIIIWVIFPFILWYTEMKDEEENTKITNNILEQDTHWKYFCFKMWLPPKATQSPLYQILWACQAFPIYSLVMIFTGYNLLFFAVTTFTAAHFKILAMILKDSSEALPQPQSMILRDSSEALPQPQSTQDAEHSTNSKSYKARLFKHTMRVLQSKEEYGKAVVLKYGRETEVAIRTNEQLQWMTDTNLKEHEAGRIQERYEAADYLVHCMRYHQALLE
jgi:multisubunit Na+/H+ antiporter MnhC subunit